MAETIVSYYQELFHSANPTNMESTTQYINPIISDEMNAKLVANFEASEVHDAIKQMAPLKAPGPDGMPPIFYQNYWDLLGADVTSFVLHFLNSASLPTNLNHTFITLIPKVKKQEFVFEFRPISLCNCTSPSFQSPYWPWAQTHLGPGPKPIPALGAGPAESSSHLMPFVKLPSR